MNLTKVKIEKFEESYIFKNGYSTNILIIYIPFY